MRSASSTPAPWTRRSTRSGATRRTSRHRFVGIAVTARYVPTQRPTAGVLSVEAYDAWAGDWYDKLSPESFAPIIRPGTALVIEDAPAADVGSIGSYNILEWKRLGCAGVVTNGTARDTDEIITEKVPLYLRRVGRGIRPGRNELESVNRPIVCGGVLVVPGRRRRGRRRRGRGRAPGQGRSRGPVRPQDHGGGQGRAAGPLQEARAQARPFDQEISRSSSAISGAREAPGRAPWNSRTVSGLNRMIIV